MKKILLAVCALLMATLAFAQDEPVVIDNTTPGKLAQLLGPEVYTITNLKVTGNINSADVKTLRMMGGFMPDQVPSDWTEDEVGTVYPHDDSPCVLAILDLSEVHLVKGGGVFFTDEYLGHTYSIEQDGRAPNYMFDRCYGLVSLILPNELKTLPGHVVSHCPKLVSLTLGNKLTKIEDYALVENTALMSLVIPEGVTELGYSSMADCTALEELTLPNSLTQMDKWAFSNCNSLKHVHFGTGLKEISHGAFKWCDGLEEIDLTGTNIETIGSYAFSSCTQLKKVTLNSGLKTIKSNAFSNDDALDEVSFPDGLASIEGSAFSSCALKEVKLPNSVTYLGHYVFNNNRLLTDFDLGTGVDYIPSYCFSGCNSLTTVDIPDNITKIGKGAFSYCMGITEVNIPTSVKSVYSLAFAFCTALESIEIPDNVETIGSQALAYCDNLKTATIGKGVKELPDLFRSDFSLEEVKLSEGLTAINSFAFEDCSSLKAITLPASLTTLGNSVGFNWPVESITCLGATPAEGDEGDEPWYGKYEDCKVYVPAVAFDAYKTSPTWKKFYEANNLFTITDGIDGVSNADTVKPVAVYDMAGKQLNGERKGINLVRMSNGKVKKVLR